MTSAAPPVARHAPRPRAAGGFTVLELLTVLAILAVAALVVLPSLGALGGGERRAVRARLVTLVREAQLDATRRGVPVRITLDTVSNRVGFGGSMYALPTGWSVERGGAEARFEPISRASAEREVVLMTWAPNGLSGAARWRAVGGAGREVRVLADTIEGVRVE